MNRKAVLYTVGRITVLEGVLLALPLLVSLYFREWKTATAFILSVLLAFAVGFLFMFFNRQGEKPMFAKTGFLTVALSWIVLALIGALPFTVSGVIPSYVDAVFETVSGFTTTGASILPDPTVLSKGLLFWRSFTHWIGGMGVIVLMLAVLPADSGRSIHIMRAEVPGPVVGKLVPRIRDTAKILYIIYLALTLLQFVFLACGDMAVFDSILHTFGTAGTGGFGIKPDGVGGYSPYSQWVITVFMLLFGMNFNLYYLLLLGRLKPIFKSAEMWCYLAIVAVSGGIVIINTLPMYETVGETVRHAFFQVSSIVTTTGFSTTDFNLWPGLSRAVIFLLLFVGGCTGSTAGGLKVGRVILLFKTIGRDLKKLLRPRSVSVVHSEGKPVQDDTLHAVTSYFSLYILLILVVFFVISFEPFSIETNFSAAVSCVNNVGPGLDAVGPTASYAGYSALSKIVLTLAMLFGRLEIYPLLFLLTPSTWSKKR